MDWSKIIYHTSPEHLAWALGEKARLDATPVPPNKVVFLGSNPSCSSPYNDPFSHCKSANKILGEWISALGLTRDQVHFMNVANYKTFGNRPLKPAEIKAELARLAVQLSDQIVVTLGAAAAKALTIPARIQPGFKPLREVINMPHPSGRNRLLNDREWVKKMLEESKEKLQLALGRAK